MKTPIKSCPRRGSAGHAHSPLAEGTLPSSRADRHSLTGFLKGLCNYIGMIQYLGSPEKRIGFCTIRRHIQASGFARCKGLCIHNTDPGSLSPPAAASTSSALPQLLARAALKGSKSLGMRRRAFGSTNGNEGSKVQRSSELNCALSERRFSELDVVKFGSSCFNLFKMRCERGASVTHGPCWLSEGPMLARIHRNLLLERRLPVTTATVEALIPAKGDLDFRKFWAPGPHNEDCRKIGSIWACIFFYGNYHLD